MMNTSSNGHQKQLPTDDQLVRVIVHDLLTDAPRYEYAELQHSAYRSTLATLITVRQQQGLHATRCVVEDCKTNDPRFATVLLHSEEQQDEEEATRQEEQRFILEGKFALPHTAALPVGLGQDASPWLDSYIAFSRKWSPRGYEGYHEGVALWILSTVAARRVVLSFGGEEYTPLFLLLVGSTSRYAKTVTAKIGYQVLEKAGLRWLLGADNTTPQKLVSDMAGARVSSGYTDLGVEDQLRIQYRLAMSGQRGWYYEEFGQHMEAMVKKDGVMSDFKGLLRQLDDCQPEYASSTIARGAEVVKNPYLALLGTMTPFDMKPYAGRDSKFWRDGLFARFSFITAPNIRGKRARFPDGERIIPGELITPLASWHRRLGMTPIDIEQGTDKNGRPLQEYRVIRGELPVNACELDSGVKDAYYRYDDALDEVAEALNVEWIRGNYARFPKKALRIAMLLASLENNGLITMQHWARAQEMAERLRASLHELDLQVNTGDASQETDEREEKVLNLLEKKARPLTAREVAQGVWGLNTAEATRLLDLLVKSGDAETQRTGRKVTYTRAPISVDVVEE